MWHVLVVLGATSSALAASLLPRAGAQTTAVCSPDFSWANNQLGLSPCLIAAYAEGACYSGTWDVPALSSGNSYDFFPDACSCSWAVYNLLSACTACQGASSSILNWAAVTTSSNCSSRISDTTYFPPNTPLPDGILIPAWAATNPSTWQNGRFNVAQAEAVAASGLPDLNPDAPTSSKSTPVGAIVGGVVGGVVVLLLGGIAIAWMIIRRRKMAGSAVPGRPPMHARSTSDLSQKTGTSAGYATFTSGGAGYYPPASPTLTSRAHSVFGSARGSIFSMISHAPSRIGSPPLSPPPVPAVQAAAPPLPENSIQPFLVSSPETPRRPLNRKTSNDTSVAPVRRDEGPSSTPGRRLNPPAYTPSESDSSQVQLPQVPGTPRQARGHRPGRGEKGSQDTTTSTRSMAPAHSRQTSADAFSTIEEGPDVPIA